MNHAATPRLDLVLPSVSLSGPGRAFLAGDPVAMEPAGDRADAREIVVDPDDRDAALRALFDREFDFSTDPTIVSAP